jgi:uncharacterized sulfatase
MDERYDLVRSVRDERYIYIRNFMPHRIYGQHIAYMFETPTTGVWKQLYDTGKLEAPQTCFWETKPAEELYDLREDPDEVRNLAGSPAHRETRDRLQKALREHLLQIRDVGFLPEGEIHSRAEGTTPYEMAHDERKYPLRRILDTAELASSARRDVLPSLQEALGDADSAVRFWAATGFLIRGQDGVTAAIPQLRSALTDPSPYVRIVAAEALARYGTPQDLERALVVLGDLAPPERNGVFVAMMALNAIDALDEKAAPLLPLMKTLGSPVEAAHPRTRGYVPRLVEKIVADLET